MFVRLKYDFKLIGKDPMLILSSATPAIFFFLLAIVIPWIAKMILESLEYDILIYYSEAGLFFTSMIPMMFGMVFGFILLDERDEGIITILSVTPYGKKKYIMNRISIPMIASIFIILLMFILLDIAPWLSLPKILLSAILLSFMAPIMLLFLGAFASNKIEGMALAKSFSIITIGLLIDFIAPEPWDWFGAFSPLFWMGRAIMSSGIQFWLFMAASIIINGLFMLWLYRKFDRRVG